MPPKPTLFIGSSSEAKPIVKEIQTLLQDAVNVRTWFNDVFLPGEHAIEALRREVLQADYALLVVTPDDSIVKRETAGFTVRDNILLELGMFMGALGPRRSFYLVINKEVNGAIQAPNIPSNLAGITRLQFTKSEHDLIQNRANLCAECVKIENAVERGQKNLELNLLPSTALAIGYFKNFVLPLCELLMETKGLKVGSATHDCTNDSFDFFIVLPDSGTKSGHAGFKSFTKKNNLEQVILANNKSRTFPFFIQSEIQLDPATGKDRVKMYDCPTTLLAAREAVRMVFPASTPEEELEALERREFQNFDRALRKMLKDPSAASFTDNIHIVYESELKNH